MSRGKGKWISDEESLALCKAWVSTSENSTTGTGMKYSVLWGAVAAKFKEIMPPGSPDRSQRSLEAKFAVIKHDAAKFSGLYAQIMDMKRSGTNLDDVEKAALDLYTKVQGESDVKGKKAHFNYLECWRFLKDCPKWDALVEDVRVAEMPSTKKRTHPQPEPLLHEKVKPKKEGVASERPLGSKAAKRLKRLELEAKSKDSQLATATNALAKAMALKAQAIAEKSSAQVMLAHAQMFSVDLETLSARSRQFYEAIGRVAVR